MQLNNVKRNKIVHGHWHILEERVSSDGRFDIGNPTHQRFIRDVVRISIPSSYEDYNLLMEIDSIIKQESKPEYQSLRDRLLFKIQDVKKWESECLEIADFLHVLYFDISKHYLRL